MIGLTNTDLEPADSNKPASQALTANKETAALVKDSPEAGQIGKTRL